MSSVDVVSDCAELRRWFSYRYSIVGVRLFLVSFVVFGLSAVLALLGVSRDVVMVGVIGSVGLAILTYPFTAAGLVAASLRVRTKISPAKLSGMVLRDIFRGIPNGW
jgi:hypothetical protein